jgi:[ribosomal protein S5]-alanine N-acetyltransferase
MNKNKFNPFPDLFSARLTLCQMKVGDRKILFQLRTDDTVSRFILRDKPADEKQVVNFINRVNGDIGIGRSVYWAIRLKSDPKLIGTVCLWNFSENGKTAELGYEMFPEFQGRGLMSEAVNAVLNYGYDSCALEEFVAYTHRDNHRSKNLLGKFGFHLMPGKIDEHNPNNEIYILRIGGKLKPV